MRESAWKRQLKQMLAWYTRNSDKTPSGMASYVLKYRTSRFKSCISRFKSCISRFKSCISRFKSCISRFKSCISRFKSCISRFKSCISRLSNEQAYNCVDDSLVSMVPALWLVSTSCLRQQNKLVSFCLKRLKKISMQIGVGMRDRARSA